MFSVKALFFSLSLNLSLNPSLSFSHRIVGKSGERGLFTVPFLLLIPLFIERSETIHVKRKKMKITSNSISQN